jgi:hypothetical protein
MSKKGDLMTKTYILNSLSKTFLVLALVNSCALFSVSAAKKKADQQKVEQATDNAIKVISPTISPGIQGTILVSTLNTNFTPATGPGSIPAYLPNKKTVDYGKLVSGGTILSNKICPWKIGGTPNPKTGAFIPLPRGTKLSSLSADNYYPDPTGTTAFCGNVSVAGDLTVTGTLGNKSGQFCLTSDVAVNPDNTLLVNTINSVKTVGGACVADDSTCAVTKFSGAADIHGRRFGTIPHVTLTRTALRILGLQFDSNIYDCPTSTPVAVKIHFIGYGTNSYDECYSVAFTEEVAISPDLYAGDTSLCILSDAVNCKSDEDFAGNVALTAVREGDLYDQNPEIFLELKVVTMP